MKMIKTHFFLICLFFSISLTSTLSYNIAMKEMNTHDAGTGSITNQHYIYLENSHRNNWQYRILVPNCIEIIRHSTGISLRYLYLGYHFIFLGLSLMFFFYFLRKWFSLVISLLGVTILSSIYIASYNIFNPSDIMVLFLFTVCSYIIVHKFHNNAYHFLLFSIFFI